MPCVDNWRRGVVTLLGPVLLAVLGAGCGSGPTTSLPREKPPAGKEAEKEKGTEKDRGKEGDPEKKKAKPPVVDDPG
jgi:hypothetical protein